MTVTKSSLLSISAVAILGLAACNKPTTGPSRTTADGSTSTAPAGSTAKVADKALVRFINATSAPKDLQFGDQTAFSNVAPMDVAPYTELSASRHEFKLYPTGKSSGEPIATNTEGPSAGEHYTIVAMNGTDGSTTLNPISDKLETVEPGKAKVRVIHAAPGVKKVDVYAAGNKDALIDGVSFKDATSYKEVDPVLTEIAVRSTGSKNNALTVRNLSLQSGKLYTLVIMGGNGQPLTTKVIEDQVLRSVASR